MRARVSANEAAYFDRYGWPSDLELEGVPIIPRKVLDSLQTIAKGRREEAVTFRGADREELGRFHDWLESVARPVEEPA